MKTLLILFTDIFISSALTGQTIEYSYDKNGNRISRRIVYLKSGKELNNTPTDTIAKKEIQEPMVRVNEDMHIQVRPNPPMLVVCTSSQ